MKSNETYSHFGKNLRKIRKAKGYTQEKLAELSGVSRRMIGHYETVVQNPSLDKVKKLSHALNVSDEELLGIKKPQGKKKKEEELSFKLMKKLRVIEELPVRDQNAIFHYINALVEKNKSREK